MQNGSVFRRRRQTQLSSMRKPYRTSVTLSRIIFLAPVARMERSEIRDHFRTAIKERQA
jgi:hypothetical protein